MAEWLRTLAARPEDLGSVPSAHLAALNHLYLGSVSLDCCPLGPDLLYFLFCLSAESCLLGSVLIILQLT